MYLGYRWSSRALRQAAGDDHNEAVKETTNMSDTKTELSPAQRLAANKIVANDINAAGLGFNAETWAQPEKGYSGVSLTVDGRKVAMLTINAAGFCKIRSYLRGTDISALAKVGFTPDQFTTVEAEYKNAGGARFDVSRLSK